AGGYGGSGWQGMISKRSWSFHRERSEVIFRMEAGENGSSSIQRDFITISDSRWHSYQLGIGAVSNTSKNYVMLYDGEIQVRDGSRSEERRVGKECRTTRTWKQQYSKIK